jgi:hypothetical protein
MASKDFFFLKKGRRAAHHYIKKKKGTRTHTNTLKNFQDHIRAREI